MNSHQTKVFLDRYALKNTDGTLLEQNISETYARVAKYVAQGDTFLEQEYYRLMNDNKFIPGGRILAGAGSGHEVTYNNCYVIECPEDSREGILDNIKALANIMARGGGVGVNLSSIRPRGSYIKTVNGTSSGSVNWAELYSIMTGKIIQQGGTRRGALMLMLDDDHPDIEEFIKAKDIDPITQRPIALEYANISVAVSDDFMAAVKHDLDWTTSFPTKMQQERLQREGKALPATIPGKTYKARDLWQMICEHAWATAEPGMVFLERANKQSNLGYKEVLIATNPCLVGSTIVQTPTGHRRLDTIQEGETISTVLGNGIVKTVEIHHNVPTFTVTFSDGGSLQATAAHQFHAVKQGQKNRKKYDTIQLRDLTVGDVVRIAPGEMPNNIVENKPSVYTDTEFGLLLGSLIGDGCITERVLDRNRVKFSVDTRETVYNARIVELLERFSHATFSATEGFGGHYTTQVQNELTDYLKNNNILGQSYEKSIPLSLQNTNKNFLVGLLDGLFSSDGNVNSSGDAPQLRLDSTSKQLLLDVRRILLSFGIHGRIFTGDQSHSVINGREIIRKHVRYTLIISGQGIRTFTQNVTLSHPMKQQKLHTLATMYALTGNMWNTTITSIVPAEDATVYDLYEPLSDTWITDGYVSRGCGEQPLGSWAVCNLGAMNIAEYILPGEIDITSLFYDTKTATKFMDAIIDLNLYFMPEIEEQKSIRRVGLGTMGLADALIKLNMTYGSDESLEMIDIVFSTIRDAAYLSSIELAQKYGPFPYYTEEFLTRPFIQSLPQGIQDQIYLHGIRNAFLLTAAPTGTTSMIAGVSSGIEPNFSFAYQRVDRTGTHTLYHPLAQQWKDVNPDVDLPAYFVCSSDISPEDHIRVQAQIQKYNDSSISKTANFPHTATVEDVQRLYELAYDLGCKGITIYRDGSRDAVLTHLPEVVSSVSSNDSVSPSSVSRRSAGKRLNGVTIRKESPEGNVHVTINADDDGPLEVFINIGRAGSDLAAIAEAFGRTFSSYLQLPSSVSPRERLQELANQLTGLGGSSFVGFGPMRTRSLPDTLGKIFQSYLDDDVQTEETTVSESYGEKHSRVGDLCPECSQYTLIHQEGCSKCMVCGYSRC